MANREQIIIDGVDVSGCISFDKDNEYNICCYEDTRGDKILFANFCVENKNCYYKQLARKTKECEQKEKELLSNEKILNKLMKEVDELMNKTDRYRKVLEEIEEFCLIYSDNHNAYETVYKYILDIIAEAKGEE